jgi:hypothetical protein
LLLNVYTSLNLNSPSHAGMQEVQEFALGSLPSSDYKNVVMRTVKLFTKEAVPPVDRYDVTLHYCLKGDPSLYELKNDDDLKSAIDLSQKTGTPKLLLHATVTEKELESSLSAPKHNAKPPPPSVGGSAAALTDSTLPRDAKTGAAAATAAAGERGEGVANAGGTTADIGEPGEGGTASGTSTGTPVYSGEPAITVTEKGHKAFKAAAEAFAAGAEAKQGGSKTATNDGSRSGRASSKNDSEAKQGGSEAATNAGSSSGRASSKNDSGTGAEGIRGEATDNPSAGVGAGSGCVDHGGDDDQRGYAGGIFDPDAQIPFNTFNTAACPSLVQNFYHYLLQKGLRDPNLLVPPMLIKHQNLWIRDGMVSNPATPVRKLCLLACFSLLNLSFILRNFDLVGMQCTKHYQFDERCRF